MHFRGNNLVSLFSLFCSFFLGLYLQCNDVFYKNLFYPISTLKMSVEKCCFPQCTKSLVAGCPRLPRGRNVWSSDLGGKNKSYKSLVAGCPRLTHWDTAEKRQHEVEMVCGSVCLRFQD
jgi:hypothetical protein